MSNDITKNMKIKARVVRHLYIDAYKYILLIDLHKSVSELLRIDKVFSVQVVGGSITMELTNYDQSTIDDVLLDVDFVLEEMLNELKNK